MTKQYFALVYLLNQLFRRILNEWDGANPPDIVMRDVINAILQGAKNLEETCEFIEKRKKEKSK